MEVNKETPRVCWNCKYWEELKDGSTFPGTGSCCRLPVWSYFQKDHYCAEWAKMPAQMAERVRGYRNDFEYPPHQVLLHPELRDEGAPEDGSPWEDLWNKMVQNMVAKQWGGKTAGEISWELIREAQRTAAVERAKGPAE